MSSTDYYVLTRDHPIGYFDLHLAAINQFQDYTPCVPLLSFFTDGRGLSAVPPLVYRCQ